MIVITGGAGFVGFNLLLSLRKKYGEDIEIVVIDNNFDNFLEKDMFSLNIKYVSVEESYLWFNAFVKSIDFIFHLGARANTMESNLSTLNMLNLEYSKFIWNICVRNKIPLIYASSAAVYGDGSMGFDDYDHNDLYKPLNEYGWSKLNFDKWIQDEEEPPFWAGLRFFNVFGPHEEHKGKMASMAYQLYNQVKETNEVKLFMSHRDDVDHGEQKRDFIYVQDVVDVIIWLYENQKQSGIFNLGTGCARSFHDLAISIFEELNTLKYFTYFEIPEKIRESYQYFTEAKMEKLRFAGYNKKFTTLEEGIKKYVTYLEIYNKLQK